MEPKTTGEWPCQGLTLFTGDRYHVVQCPVWGLDLLLECLDGINVTPTAVKVFDVPQDMPAEVHRELDATARLYLPREADAEQIKLRLRLADAIAARSMRAA